MTKKIEAAAPPPAEAQPVGELIEDGAETEEGNHFLHQFVGPHRLPEGTKIYAHPPPSAPVGVDDIAVELEYYANCPGRVLVLAGKLRALAQQPAAVDEVMVSRFLEAFRNTDGDEAIDADEKVAHRWLTAALAAQQGGSDNGR